MACLSLVCIWITPAEHAHHWSIVHQQLMIEFSLLSKFPHWNQSLYSTLRLSPCLHYRRQCNSPCVCQIFLSKPLPTLHHEFSSVYEHRFHIIDTFVPLHKAVCQSFGRLVFRFLYMCVFSLSGQYTGLVKSLMILWG